MKRTIEIGLSVLGVIISFIMVATGAVFLYLKDSASFAQYLESGWSASENAYTMEQLSQAGTMFIWPGLIGMALGIGAAWLLKGNRAPAVAGWGLVIIATSTCFISLFAALPGLFYVVAGIVALRRKPKTKTNASTVR